MKPLLYLTFAVLFSTFVLAAPPMPITWYGTATVDGQSFQNQNLCLLNKVTGESLSTITDSNGVYNFNLGNLEQGVVVKSIRSRGDVIRLGLCNAQTNTFYKEVEVIDTNPKKIDFLFDAKSVDEAGYVVTYTCAGGSIVKFKSECPENQTDYIFLGTIVAIITAGLYGLYALNKKLFKWAPGMAGIIKKKKAEYDQAVKDGDKEKAAKLKAEIVKLSETLTKKYLKG